MEITRQNITQKFMLEVGRTSDFRRAIHKIIRQNYLTLLLDLTEAVWRDDESKTRELLQVLGVLDHIFNSWLITRATHNGNINLVAILFNTEIVRDTKLLIKLIDLTMRQHHVELLEWYLSNIPSYCMDTIFLNCEIMPVILSRNGDMLEILLRHDYPRNEIEQIVELFDIEEIEINF